MQQRGTIEILLLAQRYSFDDVIKRVSDHLKHTITSAGKYIYWHNISQFHGMGSHPQNTEKKAIKSDHSFKEN